jgi:drug/metabolite transporter (DMT)-like permease
LLFPYMTAFSSRMDGLLQNGEFLSILCALIWSFAVIMFRRAGDIAPPITLNLFKNVVGLTLLLVTLLFVEGPIITAGSQEFDWLLLIGSGALGIGAADWLFFASLNRLGATGMAIVETLYSPFVVITAFFILGDPITSNILIALGLMAAAIALGSMNPKGEKRQPSQVSGLLLGVLAMAGMAVGIVLAKPALDRNPVLWSTGVRLFGGVLFLLLMGLAPGYRRSFIKVFTPGRHWRILIPASIWGTYIAMIVWIAGMKYTSAGIASVLNQTSVLLTPVLAVFFLKERLTWRKAAAVLLGFGAALSVTCL